MDWKALFLSANGRIGRRDFWLGFVVLFVANLVIGFIPGLGLLIHLASIYFWICVSSKRLHDMDKSGWLILAPYVVWIVAFVLIFITGGAAVITALVTGDETAMAAAAFSAFGVISLILGFAFLFGLAFLLWMGLAAGTPGPNRYGGSQTTAVEVF